VDYPVIIILDFIELQCVTADRFFQALLDCLQLHGMTETFLSSYLVSGTCDGAVVILGRKSGVAKLLKYEFLSIIIWHCANLRLELSVTDTENAVAGINKFRLFIDRACEICHAS
jgi:hypothetical protein